MNAKDLLGIERTLSKEEVKKELDLLRKQKLAKGLMFGCAGICTLKISPIIDGFVLAKAKALLEWFRSSALFFGLYCPRWAIIVAYLLFALACVVVWYGKQESKPAVKEGNYSIEELLK